MVSRKAPLPDMAGFLGTARPSEPKPVASPSGDLLLFDVDQFTVKPARQQLDLFDTAETLTAKDAAKILQTRGGILPNRR